MDGLGWCTLRGLMAPGVISPLLFVDWVILGFRSSANMSALIFSAVGVGLVILGIAPRLTYEREIS